MSGVAADIRTGESGKTESHGGPEENSVVSPINLDLEFAQNASSLGPQDRLRKLSPIFENNPIPDMKAVTQESQDSTSDHLPQSPTQLIKNKDIVPHSQSKTPAREATGQFDNALEILDDEDNQSESSTSSSKCVSFPNDDWIPMKKYDKHLITEVGTGAATMMKQYLISDLAALHDWYSPKFGNHCLAQLTEDEKEQHHISIMECFTKYKQQESLKKHGGFLHSTTVVAILMCAF